MATTLESLDALADATAAARTFRLALDEARAVAAAAEVAFAAAEQKLLGIARQVAGCQPADDIVLGPQHFVPHESRDVADGLQDHIAARRAVSVIDDPEADLTPPPAPAALAGDPEPAEPSWRKMPLGETGWHNEWGEEAYATISAAVPTCGELADRLLKGETFGLPLTDLVPVWAAVEQVSEDDEHPIKFEEHGPDDLIPSEPMPFVEVGGPPPVPPVSVGDVIRTSYGTGPYVVTDVSRDGVRGGCKWSLTLGDANVKKGGKNGTSWINGVELQPDGRITSLEGKDELFVVPKGQPCGPDYFDWCRDAGLVRDNGNPDLQRAWMRGEAAPAAKPAVTRLAGLDGFPDAVADRLAPGITTVETLLDRVEQQPDQIREMPLRNKIVTFLVNAGVKIQPAGHAADAVADHVPGLALFDATPAATACPAWRSRTLAEAGVTAGPAAWSQGTLQQLKKAGVETFGQLADKLLAGETFLLLREPLREMCDAVEALSSADPEPIVFADVPKPIFEAEPAPKPEPTPARKPAPATGEKPYGWDITYVTTDGQELRCHYTGTRVKAERRAMARPKAKHVIKCEPLTEREYTTTFGRGGM